MKPFIEIRRNADGVVQKYRDDYEWLGDYIWEGGNYSCDCNRALFFERARGENPAWDSVECGDGGYSVKITDEAGAVLYADGAFVDGENAKNAVENKEP